MKLFVVHPSALMYSKIFLRLEPLGLELVAEAARKAGHQVRLMDLQAESHKHYFKMMDDFRPDVVAFSCNYLANVPEIVDLAKDTKARWPRTYIAVGGHSASFVAEAFLEHGDGAIDCVIKGEGEPAIVPLMEAVQNDRNAVHTVPGAITEHGYGPAPRFVESLDDLTPARDLLRHRRKYFIGVLDPAASIEFTRGCPWDCSFCSAWTFYGRSYRAMSTEKIVEEVKRIQEPGVFLVDDVAFVQAKHGFEIGEALLRADVRKTWYMETRADVFNRNEEVFALWKRLGLKYMFIGLEAIDEEGLKAFRKRVTLDRSFQALETARKLGIQVAVNLIADPDWDEKRFEVVRQWCMEVPEVVNISVLTPYPGTENWMTDARKLATRDYRLFDIQHAVLPTKLPLPVFYEELVKTQRVLAKKHLGFTALKKAATIAAGHALRGQTNFLRMLWKFDSVYNPKLQLADHAEPVRYELPEKVAGGVKVDRSLLYIHQPQGRKGRSAIDDKTEEFVDETRMGASV
ncbi:MAG: hopanoid C-3 methylase HpnR [Myxococcota bacterium]